MTWTVTRKDGIGPIEFANEQGSVSISDGELIVEIYAFNKLFIPLSIIGELTNAAHARRNPASYRSLVDADV